MMIDRRKISGLLFLTICVVFWAGCAASPSPNNDGKLQGEIARKLNGDAELAKVYVVVNNGVASLNGEVTGDAAKSKAASLAKIEGISEVRSEIKVLAPTPLPTPPQTTTENTQTTTEDSEPEMSLEEEAQKAVETFIDENTAQCGEFYYFRSGGTIYQCKYPHTVEVEGREFPAPQYSEADRLNKIDKTWVQWSGLFEITLNLCRSRNVGKDYWNVYYSSADGLKTPREWMDKEERKKKPVRKVNGKWEVINESDFQVGTKIEKVTCADVPK